MAKIEWITIPAPDIEKAKLFYEEVFGFEISEYSENFWVFKTKNISGGLDANLKVAEQGIGFSITVYDMMATLALLEKYGAKVVRERYSLGKGAGYCAACLDPNGNRLELYSQE